MVHIYYHIYAIDGVDTIIDEQLSLIEKHFDFPYILNVGISIANQNVSSKNIIERFYKYNKPNYRIRDIRVMGNEFTTLDLIEEDMHKFGDSDYILYIHTKGSSKMYENYYSNLEDWRHLMNYFNIEKYKNAFKIFTETEFNTYGVNLHSPMNIDKLAYFGNFWWAKSNYLKSINFKKSDKYIRVDAEFEFIQHGENWKPYCVFNSGINHYYESYPKEKYR